MCADPPVAPHGYAGVAVAVPITFGYARTSPHPVPWFAGGALRELLRQSKLDKSQIDGLVFASYRQRPDNAASLCEYLGLSPRVVADVPFGGGSGVPALRLAARTVQAGDAEVMACIAADVRAGDASHLANFSNFVRDHVHPQGAGGANAVFALITDDYMRRSSARAEDFGRLCVAQRDNGRVFPGALLTAPLSLADYLSARPVADPLRLFDCVLPCCGAEAFLVMSEDRARSLRIPWARVAAAVERVNASPTDAVQRRTLAPGDDARLWMQARLGPEDMDFIQAYDDYPVIVMLQIESLGFCAEGEAAAWLRMRNARYSGDFPINTQGGMLSLGQAGAAGGFSGLTEALRQLTGRALGGAVEDARAGVVSCYGTVNYDRGLCASAAVLTAGARA